MSNYKIFLTIFLLFTYISIQKYNLIYHDYFLLNRKKNYFFPNRFRIAFIFGTRPEAIKLFPLINELKHDNNFISIIINTGQHKEMIEQILVSLNIKDSIDFNLNIMKKNQSLAKLTSKSIIKLDNIFNLINPNAIIVQGDTTTAFCAAVTAFYKKIPIFHVEAGLRTHNLHYPFPEEFNRITIDDISTLYFAPTDWAATNLLKEYKNSSNIFITGNTVVDSLHLTFNKTSPSKKLKNLLEKAKSLCLPTKECKIILLTCHRRENFFKPIYNILNAIQELLKKYNNIVIIFPFHLNPNVQQSIKDIIPNIIFDEILNRKKIENKNFLHLNRLLIIPPLNYFDLIHLESASYFIMTDSGGIQEEAVIIGKPILILRENTERPEAVNLGCAFLTGTSFKTIFNYASSLIINEDFYKNISKCQNIYGEGNSSVIISKIIQNYFKGISQKSFSINRQNYENILFKYDNFMIKNKLSPFNNFQVDLYDFVIVLTVWKRNNLERQLIQIKNQSVLKNKKTNIIIFQNANHINIENIVNKWKKSGEFSEKVDITFIQSPIETGYFGRFIIPLTSSVGSNSYFFICDDDVIWGNKYFENMIRVVNEGYLATRNGRIVSEKYVSTCMAFKKSRFNHVCYNEDIEYDYGGHIWAGRISWLRKAWNHIPVSLENSEDFWVSAVLKSYYNISTKTPKCPCPEGNPIIPDMCAASDQSARKHYNANLGESSVSHKIRGKLIKEIIHKYNYKILVLSKPEYVKSIPKKFVYGNKLFNLTDDMWKDALLWQ